MDFFNLLPGIKTAQQNFGYETKELYYLQDKHWTAKGHQLAGILLNEAIRQKYLSAH